MQRSQALGTALTTAPGSQPAETPKESFAATRSCESLAAGKNLVEEAGVLLPPARGRTPPAGVGLKQTPSSQVPGELSGPLVPGCRGPRTVKLAPESWPREMVTQVTFIC